MEKPILIRMKCSSPLGARCDAALPGEVHSRGHHKGSESEQVRKGRREGGREGGRGGKKVKVLRIEQAIFLFLFVILIPSTALFHQIQGPGSRGRTDLCWLLGGGHDCLSAS